MSNGQIRARISFSMRRLYRFAERILGTYCAGRIRELYVLLSSLKRISVVHIYRRQIYTPYAILKNSHLKDRKLEIGPGKKRLEGFETLDVCGGRNVDYVWDIRNRLPFRDESFSLVYASHVLEHIPWYLTEKVLRDWFRILMSGGRLEVWVPDARKVFETVLATEKSSVTTLPEEWLLKNPNRNVYRWAQGRLLYGANEKYPSWHLSFFTEGYLEHCLNAAGFSAIHRLSQDEVRGCGHGWINLGISGRKP